MIQLHHHSGDLSGLLLLHSAAGDKEGMKSLALKAQEVGRSNVAFLAFFVTGNYPLFTHPLSIHPLSTHPLSNHTPFHHHSFIHHLTHLLSPTCIYIIPQVKWRNVFNCWLTRGAYPKLPSWRARTYQGNHTPHNTHNTQHSDHPTTPLFSRPLYPTLSMILSSSTHSPTTFFAPFRTPSNTHASPFLLPSPRAPSFLPPSLEHPFSHPL